MLFFIGNFGFLGVSFVGDFLAFADKHFLGTGEDSFVSKSDLFAGNGVSSVGNEGSCERGVSAPPTSGPLWGWCANLLCRIFCLVDELL